MSNSLFEYIWLDGTIPEPTLRSKIKIIDYGIADTPGIWYFDGSSTNQASGRKSDCALVPIKRYINPFFQESKEENYLVLCEVMNSNMNPHETNTRHAVKDLSKDSWFGFEQEYLFIDAKHNCPLGHPTLGYPREQGDYYCGVGANNVVGRKIVEKHLDYCQKAGLKITGINAEVLLGQWEYQLFGQGVGAADDLWISRYILNRICEEFDVIVDYSPKPIKGDWNGSGLHTNFSNLKMREIGGEEYFNKIFDVFKNRRQCHIDSYGSGNHERLTGKHETAPIDEFSWGISDRGSSMRVPQPTAKEWKGYLEDRRPAANADPYKIIKVIDESLSIVDSL